MNPIRHIDLLTVISLAGRAGNCRFPAQDQHVNVAVQELPAYFIDRPTIDACRRPLNDRLITFKPWQWDRLQVLKLMRMCVVSPRQPIEFLLEFCDFNQKLLNFVMI